VLGGAWVNCEPVDELRVILVQDFGKESKVTIRGSAAFASTQTTNSLDRSACLC
jgi:hypothetical protein